MTPVFKNVEIHRQDRKKFPVFKMQKNNLTGKNTCKWILTVSIWRKPNNWNSLSCLFLNKSYFCQNCQKGFNTNDLIHQNGCEHGGWTCHHLPTPPHLLEQVEEGCRECYSVRGDPSIVFHQAAWILQYNYFCKKCQKGFNTNDLNH